MSQKISIYIKTGSHRGMSTRVDTPCHVTSHLSGYTKKDLPVKKNRAQIRMSDFLRAPCSSNGTEALNTAKLQSHCVEKKNDLISFVAASQTQKSDHL